MVARSLEIVYFALQIFSIAALSILTYTLLFGLKQPGVSRPNPLLAGYCLFIFDNDLLLILMLL
jgi:hypothetical protein